MSWQEFHEEPTADLVEYMRVMGPGDQASADDAFHAFILRFRVYLQKLCRRVVAGYGYESYIGDQIAEETFLKFRTSSSFSPDKCKSPNLDQCIKLYLAKTARRALIDYDRKEKDENPFDGSEELAYEMPNIDDLRGDPERLTELKKQYEVVELVLSRLSDKHRIIYLTYKQYEHEMHRRDPDENGNPRQYYPPRPLLEKLRKETGLTQSTIRKYKEEANNMIEQLLKVYGNK